MSKFYASTLIGLILASAQISAADSPPGNALANIAPLVNDETVLIARYDLARLDIATTTKQWLEPFAMAEQERKILTAVVDQFDRWSQQLKAEGVSQFYIVSSIGDLPGPELIARRNADLFARLLGNSTFAVIPGASSHAIEELHKTLQEKAKQTWPRLNAKMWPDCRQIQGAAVVGMGTLLDKLGNLTPAARPEFETAMAAAENQPICVAVVPPPVFARAAREILREPLPGSNVPIGPILANGFRWMAVGEEPDLGKFELRVIIQSASAEAAQALANAIRNGATEIGKKMGSDTVVAAVAGAAQLFSLLPEAQGDRVTLSVDKQKIEMIRGLAENALTAVTAAAIHRQTQNNLKQIGLAILNSENVHRQYPDRAIRDKDGKPLLSWRVAVLPYLEENDLYKEFHLDEPWDSEHNRKLIDRMPKVFQSPDTGSQHPGRTRYLAPVGESLMFPLDGSLKIKDVTDGTSKTLMVLEVDPEHAVVWTKPDDLEVDLENPRRGLFNGSLPFNACWADGSVRTIRNDVDAKTLRALFTRNGGEAIDPSSF